MFLILNSFKKIHNFQGSNCFLNFDKGWGGAFIRVKAYNRNNTVYMNVDDVP